MKKLVILAFLVASTLAACGGKKGGDTTTPTGDTAGSATEPGSGDMGSGEAAPAEGEGAAPAEGEPAPAE